MTEPVQKMDGMNYAPKATGKNTVVVGAGEFIFSVIGLDHGHIYAMTNGLLEAGATLEYVYDDDREKTAKFLREYPQAKEASSKEEVLAGRCHLIASAIRPDRRFQLGLDAMNSGKDFFVDKPGVLSLDELETIRKTVSETGRKYNIYFGERIHVEGAVMAQNMIDDGLLGDIVSIQILAPHRLNPATRPYWFWKPELNGPIITDIGCHQLEQFLSYAHARTARILSSVVGNKANPEHPEFQDYGQFSMVTDNGVACFCRLDWFTPDGLGAWGDGRVFITGTKATLEIRKYIDVARENTGDQLYFVDRNGEHHLNAYGKTGFPFFGAYVLDCLNRTENAMTQDHVLESMRLSLVAQASAAVL